MKKGAIGLSINMLVVIIISLVMLGLGITLLYQFIGGATEIKEGLDVQTEQELERLLVNQGQQVALPLHVATLQRGDHHAFGIGILNIGGVGMQFTIDVQLSKVIDDEERDITIQAGPTQSWLLYAHDPLIIEEHEHRKEAILISPPAGALKGQYIFNVKIYTAEGRQYGNTQKFIVNVR